MDAAQHAEALAAAAVADVRAGRLELAARRCGEAAGLARTAPLLHNLATVRQLTGDHAGAEPLFREALALAPGEARIEASLALSLLAQGRLAEGFRLYDSWRLVDSGTRPAPQLPLPTWRGEPVAGRNLVVWGEEGFGDQIMYARFANLLREEGAQVGWACHSGLVRLVREGLGMPAVALGGTIRVEGAHYVVPSSLLPVVFMPRLADPPAAPYLRAPAPNLRTGARIGVVAAGNPEHENDRFRSLPPGAAAELMRLPGAVSLAPADTGARDFWDTAGIVQGLDLVISVDTSAAHLAGALGKPVWVLLPAIGCDWRWGEGRSDSAWYPTARLFRQRTPGDWSEVLAEILAALGDAPPHGGGAVREAD